MLRIPFTLRGNDSIVGYAQNYVSLFDDTPKDVMETARSLRDSFPILLPNLISKQATGSTTNAAYINVTKATRILKIAMPPDQDFDEGVKILLGEGQMVVSGQRSLKFEGGLRAGGPGRPTVRPSSSCLLANLNKKKYRLVTNHQPPEEAQESVAQ